MPRLTSSIASIFSDKIISGLWRSTYLMRPWKVCALPPLDFSACSTSSCLALVAFWRDISLQLVPTMRRFTPGTLHLLGTCSQQSAWAAPISKMSKKTQGVPGALQRDSRSKSGTRRLSTIVANFAQAGSASTEEAWIHFFFRRELAGENVLKFEAWPLLLEQLVQRSHYPSWALWSWTHGSPCQCCSSPSRSLWCHLLAQSQILPGHVVKPGASQQLLASDLADSRLCFTFFHSVIIKAWPRPQDAAVTRARHDRTPPTLKNESVSALRTLRYIPQGRAPP